MSDQFVDMLEAVQRPQIARLQAENKALTAEVAALRVALATLADWALEAGGWRLFYYADREPPPGVFDLTDRINPDLLPEMRQALDRALAGDARVQGGH